MSDRNPERHKRLKEMLLNTKREMWNGLREEIFGKLGRDYASQYDIPHDLEESSLLDLIEDTGLAIADIRRKRLERLEESLKKLETGGYGLCDNCSREIDEERLEAMPFAELCIDCERDREEGEVVKKPTL